MEERGAGVMCYLLSPITWLIGQLMAEEVALLYSEYKFSYLNDYNLISTSI